MTKKQAVAVRKGDQVRFQHRLYEVVDIGTELAPGLPTVLYLTTPYFGSHKRRVYARFCSLEAAR